MSSVQQINGEYQNGLKFGFVNIIALQLHYTMTSFLSLLRPFVIVFEKVIKKNKTFSKIFFFSFFILQRDGSHHSFEKLFLSEKKGLFKDVNRLTKTFFSVLDNFFGYGKERFELPKNEPVLSPRKIR